MKGILHKTEQGFYMLFNENKQWIGVTGDCDGKKLKLSKQNCDEIFGVVNVDRFSHEHCDRLYHEGDINWERYRTHFKEGFNKSMEIQKDKLFTVDDMKKAIAFGWDYEGLSKEEMIERYNFKLEYDNSYAEDTDTFIQSLQQPTEIEVEIEMETCQVMVQHGDMGFQDFPKQDKNGCLILRKK